MNTFLSKAIYLSLIGVLSFSLSESRALSFSNIQTLELKRLSNFSNSIECEQRVNAFAEKLKALSDASIVSALCERDEIDRYYLDGKINFKVNSKLIFPRVMNVYGDILNDYAIYRTLKDCESDIERQEKIFQETTNIMILGSYCYNPSMMPGNEWALQIQGVGFTNIKKMVASLPAFSTASQIPESILEAILENLSKKTDLGITITHISTEQKSAYQSLRVDYYGENRIFLDSSENLYYENMESCKADVEKWTTSIGQAKAFVGMFCENSFGISRPRLSIVTAGLELDSYVQNYLQIPMKNLYSSRNSCLQDETKFLNQLREQGIEAYAYLCTYQDKQFKASVLIAP